jgi:hypothetical protein
MKDQGNIQIKEFKGRNNNALLVCKTCGKCFSETFETPFFRLKTSIDEIAKVISLIPKLGSIRAVARYTDHKPDTILGWLDLIMENKEFMNDYFYKYYHYSPEQINNIWYNIEKRRRNKLKKESD